MVANTGWDCTIDVIVFGLNKKRTGINNIDIYDAIKIENEVLRVKKIWKDSSLTTPMIKITNDELKWNWERSTDGGQTWDIMWQLNYTRLK